jgi:hypothetical protein
MIWVQNDEFIVTEGDALENHGWPSNAARFLLQP